MKKISLTQDKYALVDDADFEWLNQWRWCFDGQYAASRINGRKVRMHRIIMNNPLSKIDHKDNNKLNYQRDNLRVATDSQNNCNKGRRVDNTSGQKGVSWDSYGSRWRAYIDIDGKRIYLGSFKTKLEATAAYTSNLGDYHKEFARTT